MSRKKNPINEVHRVRLLDAQVINMSINNPPADIVENRLLYRLTIRTSIEDRHRIRLLVDVALSEQTEVQNEVDESQLISYASFLIGFTFTILNSRNEEVPTPFKEKAKTEQLMGLVQDDALKITTGMVIVLLKGTPYSDLYIPIFEIK